MSKLTKGKFNRKKLSKDLIEWILVLAGIIGFMLMGFGLGQLMEISNYTKFLGNPYILNITIQTLPKMEALIYSQHIYTSTIIGMTNTMTGYIIMLFSIIFEMAFKWTPKKQRKKKKYEPKFKARK